jgi:hypothetical protein
VTNISKAHIPTPSCVKRAFRIGNLRKSYQKSWFGISLYDAVIMGRRQKCKDRRDRIWALCGICPQLAHMAPKPNSQATLRELQIYLFLSVNAGPRRAKFLRLLATITLMWKLGIFNLLTSFSFRLVDILLIGSWWLLHLAIFLFIDSREFLQLLPLFQKYVAFGSKLHYLTLVRPLSSLDIDTDELDEVQSWTDLGRFISLRGWEGGCLLFLSCLIFTIRVFFCRSLYTLVSDCLLPVCLFFRGSSSGNRIVASIRSVFDFIAVQYLICSLRGNRRPARTFMAFIDMTEIA